jgi:ribosomal-protein-alanine N-acetyltransferase
MGSHFATHKPVVRLFLREASTSDAMVLAELNAAASAHPWSASQFDFDAERILLIEHDAEPRGFIVFSYVLDVGSILNIAVRPDCQRRGMAAQLLTGALRAMGELGVDRCLLEVRSSNGGAAALYESFGFQVDATRKNYYPAKTGREDAILMSKNLLIPVPVGSNN